MLGKTYPKSCLRLSERLDLEKDIIKKQRKMKNDCCIIGGGVMDVLWMCYGTTTSGLPIVHSTNPCAQP
jgi:hypothetical protein